MIARRGGGVVGPVGATTTDRPSPTPSGLSSGEKPCDDSGPSTATSGPTAPASHLAVLYAAVAPSNAATASTMSTLTAS